MPSVHRALTTLDDASPHAQFPMTALSPFGAVIAGAVLLALIAAAVCALFTGLRARAEAAQALADNARLAATLGAAPALAMLVRGDGRVEMEQRLADWLGLVAPVATLDALADGSGDTGLAPADVRDLIAVVTVIQRAGSGFVRSFRPAGSVRTLRFQGERAPAALASGGALVWVFDTSASEDEIARLRSERNGFAEVTEVLSALVEAAPMPMWHRDARLRLTMVNGAYAEAIEATDAADVLARGLELVDASGMGGPVAGAAAARTAQRIHEQRVSATIGGDRRMLRVVDVPLPTGGVAGFAIDIEDAERARLSLRRFADAQRTMLDRLSAGVAQFGADRALAFCNQPFRRMFAMRSEWLADRPEFERVLERMREANRLPEVRDFPGWKADRRGWFIETAEAIEETWHLPGGTHIRVIAQPLPDAGLLMIFEDRTEQVQLASARDTLLQVRTATFDNLFEALGVFAADGRLQVWNNRFRALWDFEEEFLSGHPRVDAVAEKIASRLRAPTRARLIAEFVRSATIDRQQRGGQVALADGRHFEFAAVPLPDGNALFTMLDITDSRRIEQALRDRASALEAADRGKSAFVANMSRELHTPLSAVAGLARTLHAGEVGELPPEARDCARAILDSAQRLGTMIDDVLDLAQDGGRITAPTDVDIVEVARRAAEAVRGTAVEKGIDLAVETLRTAGRVPGDPRRIAEAIDRLLRHAIGSTGAGGRVLLHADGDSRRARIVISDDGAGMDATAAAHAFDRFAPPSTATGVDRALSLGLPLARHFVAAHGGTIALVSEPGEGSVMTIELPRR